MSSDETYLEAFMETLSTLPHQVRRNMDLMRDLDLSSQKCSARLQKLHQQYISQAEAKMMQLELVHKLHTGETGVRTLSGDDVTLPTTREFMDYTLDRDMFIEIDKLQQETIQMSDEKVAIAQQSYEMIDATVQRLDRDMEAMEKLLQVSVRFGPQLDYTRRHRFSQTFYMQSSGNFQSKEVGQVNDLVACQPTLGSEWILGKIVSYDSSTGMYVVADEDVESNKSKSQRVVYAYAAHYDSHAYSVVYSISFTRGPGYPRWAGTELEAGRQHLRCLSRYDIVLSSNRCSSSAEKLWHKRSLCHGPF
jgi:hypothetical protein